MKSLVRLVAAPVVLAVAVLANAVAVRHAGAADMDAPRPVAAPAATWTGFYLGGNFGWGSGKGDFSGTNVNNAFMNPVTGASFDTEFFSGSQNLNGIFGGVQGGYNYQLSPDWMIGVEADFDAADLHGSSNYCSTSPSLGSIIGCASSNSRFSEIGTFRGRVGITLDNWLVYGTGGWAYAVGSATGNVTCVDVACPGASDPFTAIGGSTSINGSGWAAGGGVEWQFLPNWLLRVEYLHVQLDDVATNYRLNGTILAGPTFTGPTPFTIAVGSQSTFDVDTVRVGLSYLFK
jgi:outer membrane immunogenic protein